MKVKINVIDGILAPLRLYGKRDNFSRKEVDENPPLRAELFSTEQMEQHAQQLATYHAVVLGKSAELLLKELSENERILFQVNELLQESVKEKKSISPAAEWLLDNFYLIDDQIRIAKRHLPKDYSKGLPKLQNGPFASFPRVYSIAVEIISHSDGHIDIHRLENSISAYQRETHLTLGELWAFPIMLRLALIENLSRVAARIAVDRNDSALANKWAKMIIEIAENNPKELVLIIADMARSNPPMVSAFVAEFARKLQWKGVELTLPLHWLEQQLSGTGNTISSMVLIENQNQAADQVSVSNSINSLRFLAKTDWRDFVERMSVVEQILLKDIHGTYGNMDFHTRDHYRHVVEEIAGNSGLSEGDVARIAADLARKSFDGDNQNLRKAHVGYYLLDEGVKLTEKEARVRLSLWKAIKKRFKEASGGIYALTIIVVTFFIAYGMVAVAAETTRIFLLIWIGLLSLVSASHFAVAVSNWWSTLWIKPKPLPKLNFSTGIPDEFRTMVVVPTLLVSREQTEKLMKDLEVRFLSNRDKNLVFALLTDFRDAPQKTMPEDEALIKFAEKRIVELNRQYDRTTNDTFFLFHRYRVWNNTEKIWMGYERKRGKLSDLNHLLRANSKNRFASIIGDEQVYKTVQYIITLDTDTQLPRDAAWKLVGLMAHPLNRPVLDEERRCIVDGFGVIQPRVAISLHGATRSGFTKLHENDSGIDPYTRVTSDVYQDLFQEGSFIGKGIYEIDAFEKTMNDRFPDNRILSHDLLEGAYARCGFASDIQLYEDYPSHYQVDINRRHRWIRGDWQIGNWFLPTVPGRHSSEPNPISTLSRWKIFDNLRRSLIPITHLLLLIAGWTVLPYAWFWTLMVLAIMLLPSLLTSLWSSTRKPREIDLTQHITNTVGITSKSVLQSVFSFVCLPFEAFISMDAIAKTLWRIFISRKKLLEWSPSDLHQKQKTGLLDTYKTMRAAPALSIVMVIVLIWLGSTAPLFIALPFLLLWMASPAIVTILNKPLSTSKTNLNEIEKKYLRELARKSWAFFEKLVGPDDNWLPPDNLQQYPIPVVAHRTSPTNIGLSLLANLSACDFGYCTTSQLMERTTATFETLQKLERYQGHFYNWYDTQSLEVLHPRYISTVDSGNFAGHLLTFRQGLLAIPHQKIIERKIVKGIQDTLRLTLQEISTNENGLRTAIRLLHDSIANWNFQLHTLKESLESTFRQFQELISCLSQPQHEWCVAFEHHINLVLKEISLSTPWTDMPIPEKFKNWKAVTEIPSLIDLSTYDKRVKPELVNLRLPENSEEENRWLDHLENSLEQISKLAQERIATLHALASEALTFSEMEYSFLYDKSQHLLSIGFNVTDHRCDTSYYDLLASEARLSTFVAIAQGKIPQESWFALGRRLTLAGSTPVLLSWSGSMFEYLMPALVMPTYHDTLLDKMCIGTVIEQIEYGELQGVPWGISESCYNLVDTHLTYQYRAFGVPGLGFKRGLGQDLVIAPYATLMALMVDPQRSYENLQRMKAKGFEGQYGFYEAIDYTPSRLLREQQHAIIKTFMAHHQGMGLLALSSVLLDQPMQKRFEADTQFQTSLLLLQEQVPKTVGFYSGSTDHEEITFGSSASEIRVIKTANTPVPEVQLLSNGRYFVMLTNAGGGYSRWKEIALTRWREDSTCDNWGMWCYIHDRDRNQFWSTAYQPTLKTPDQYEAVFSQGKVEFRRHDEEIETYTTIIVSPEDDVEVRRIHITNHASTQRKLSITCYGEVVLAGAVGDESHTTFSNLFVQTEINEHQHAITCTRRPRSKDEQPPWMFHLMKVSDAEVTQVSYETDRSKFIGRGNTLAYPQALKGAKPLSGSQGSVLDPIVSIQYKITLPPGDSVTIDVVTGVAETREVNQSLIDKYQDKHLRDRAFELSWTHSQVVLRQIGATEADAQLFGKLASSILYLNPAHRAHPNIVLKNQRQQSALWSYAISGDLPIVLLMVSDQDNISIVKQLIKAKAYWQMKGLAVDLVILNEDPGGYRQLLQDQIQGLVTAGIGTTFNDRQGRIFVRPIDQVSTEDRILLQAVARVILSDKKGSLEDQVNKFAAVKPPVPKLVAGKATSLSLLEINIPEGLQYFNETGGFSPDGKEYIILSNKKKKTPLPWINVIANPVFGTIISEQGSSYTWFENAHEFRLTPWRNDPLLDSCGEALYVRDDESLRFWSPMGLPATGQSNYVIKHGFGYSNFQHLEEGILTDVTIHVDQEMPVKFLTLKITNQSDKARKLSVTGFMEWVLGELRSKTAMHISTEFDSQSRALIARNRYHADFAHHVAFFDVDDPNHTYTTDRTEFIGRNGTLENPDAMIRQQLSGKSGACLDSCAAIMVPFSLESGKERILTFRLGAGKNLQEVVSVLQKLKQTGAAVQSLHKIKEFWSETLGTVQVETPDASLNILANGWLLYQVLSCRLWGRSGLYQSGGAFGFRDQLQDTLALMHAKPELTRKQILLCASRQFREGDVQHWWHSPIGRGVRTLCSDDYLWLPFVTTKYITATGDSSVLQERISFLEGRKLNIDEESYYDLPVISDKQVSLYEHCKQAILYALRFGEHGLPLIGSGDWNDGMNMVGMHGKGESVWLAFFLYDTLNRFKKIASLQKDEAFVSTCEEQAKLLKKNIHTHAWDGQWYLRAYFDDGSPLGSKNNEECKIDAISQSWSVLSRGGESKRSRLAMEAVNSLLINRERGLIQLLTPPFDKAEMDPGYIKGYVPGVRENGGQYSHAAIWMVMAFAKQGDWQRTEELLRMINPILHSTTPEELNTYKTEPYVMAADVYGVDPHTGRGGWTWYTGSAGWMYQLILESFLGITRNGDKLNIEPCVPEDWKLFTVHYKFQETMYHIQVTSGSNHETSIQVDQVKQSVKSFQLVNDQKDHHVLVTIGRRSDENMETNISKSVEKFPNDGALLE